MDKVFDFTIIIKEQVKVEDMGKEIKVSVGLGEEEILVQVNKRISEMEQRTNCLQTVKEPVKNVAKEEESIIYKTATGLCEEFSKITNINIKVNQLNRWLEKNGYGKFTLVGNSLRNVFVINDKFKDEFVTKNRVAVLFEKNGGKKLDYLFSKEKAVNYLIQNYFEDIKNFIGR